MKKNSIPKLELVFLLLLTGMCPQAHATDDGRNASPQKTYAVDLTLGSATVLTFTEAVTSQTGVLFSYESALSQMPLGDVSVHETAAPLEHILEKVFKGRGFRYKVVDRIVVLTYDTDSARSQLVLVTGRVKDGSGTPLVGASVVVKDTMRGVSAGAEGNYRIFVDPDATLVFSYIGYADREERIGTKSAIDVVLEEYEAVLEDVVVVGYGTQSRRTVTAAISKFDGHLLEGIPVNSVGDALKGRVPGVRVATTDATPGADPKFLIRGGSSINQSNDPIVLVDGVVREMAGLNPNDIESVSFLKDAAAAGIYGSRASNGVILITTKKGSKHLGPRIVFEGQWAWASPATKFDLMNARDYILTVRPALMEGYCGGMDPASVLGGENSLAFRQCGQLRLRTLQRRMEPPGLGHGVACRGRSSGGCAALQHERCPDGDPRRRDSSDREHHSRMPAMKSVTARTAAASSPPSAQTSTSVPCLSPNARSERMLTALASRAAVRRVILAGASPLINFTSSPAGRACMPFGAVIVTFPVVI